MTVQSRIGEVTERIAKRSRNGRAQYVERIGAAAEGRVRRGHLSCSNLAHGFAGCATADKANLRGEALPNLGIVTAYNDMLSAHQPYGRFPDLIKQAARAAGGTAQVAGGVPAMCDGVTQGQTGMELSLFSRDTIAMAAAIGLSHDMFDAAVYLGICDKIVPGLMIAALTFGHIPAVFVPAGPMPSGLPNLERSKARQLYAERKISREELLEIEARSYHAPGTCTFYGTANSNQMLMEIMGLHIPGASFVNPNTPLRDALTGAATARALAITALGNEYTPVGRIIDERAVVNGIVGLLATGGSTNHTLHLVAVARAAGIHVTWDDFADLSSAVPLLARIYPSGSADVNQFHQAGGMQFLMRELLGAGLLHEDVETVWGTGLKGYLQQPVLDEGDTIRWQDGPTASGDETILAPAAKPFSPEGGLKLLTGNLGRAVIKVSAVDREHQAVEAPAVVFDSQEGLREAFRAGRLDRDFVAVIRFQGPRANGMPELHKLTPTLGLLQDRGHKVALVTDGRMSGASGKVPAAIHVTPEAAEGGMLAQIRDGDVIRLDAPAGTLEVLANAADLAARAPTAPDLSLNEHGMGRELFRLFRMNAQPAELGAGVLWRRRSFGTAAETLATDRPNSPCRVTGDWGRRRSRGGMERASEHHRHEALHSPSAGAAASTLHDKHAGHSVGMFRDRFWVCLVLTIPALIWDPMIQDWFGFRAPAFAGAGHVPAVFGTIVFFYGGWVFLQGAVRELAARLPGMMTLIGLAISVAFVYSAAVTLGFAGHPLWWELATLVTIMLLGHWIEMRSIFQAQGALKELAKLLPDTALRLAGDDRTEEVPVDQLRDGDLLLIRPGASLPADGVVRSGKSSVNESMITGESLPVAKGENDKVIAGTINGEGSLRVEVTGTGDKTALAGIMRLVAEAQTSRSRAQALADRAAFFLTIVAIAAGAATLVVWLALGATLDFTITRMVTVLVIACPHALGLAVPLVIAISTTMGARSGLLVRDRRGLEEARGLNTVVFDKTGTLTLGEHRVVETATAPGIAEDQALPLAAAVERDSEHPIARALLKSAEERGLPIPRAEDFRAIPGRGVEATVNGRRLMVGGPALLDRVGAKPPAALRQAAERFGANGQAAIYLVGGDRVVAVFAVADAIRPESYEAVERLHREGIEVAMLTGDSKAVADTVARELGIDTVFAEVLPADKAEKIRELQAQGKRVAMVGDGVNDAPALVTADIGIAIGAGTDVAVEAGDVVLVRSDPRDVPRIVRLSRASYRKMLQNLWWAAGYNVFAIPLAAGVLAWAGILLAPAVGAILMSASTVVVAINAQLLRRAEV